MRLSRRPAPIRREPKLNWCGTPPKKINGFCIVRIEIAAVAYGSFAMTLLVYFLLHTSRESGEVLAMTLSFKNRLSATAPATP